MNISNDILGIWIFVVSVMVIPYVCWQLASIRDKQNEIKCIIKDTITNTEEKKLRKECKYCDYPDKQNCPLL